MGWQLGLLEATQDGVVTQQEVSGLVSDTINSAVSGMVMVGMLSMVVKGFYEMLGPKKYVEQKEVLGMVKKIW